ncbi:unnamed protein product [Lota lota]
MKYARAVGQSRHRFPLCSSPRTKPMEVAGRRSAVGAARAGCPVYHCLAVGGKPLGEDTGLTPSCCGKTLADSTELLLLQGVLHGHRSTAAWCLLLAQVVTRRVERGAAELETHT